MSNVFFAEIIKLNDFESHFRSLSLQEAEMLSLLNDLRETLHAKTLNFILDELPYEHHETFMVVFSERPEDLSHWDFLHEKSPGIKEKVLQKVEEFKEELLNELKS